MNANELSFGIEIETRVGLRKKIDIGGYHNGQQVRYLPEGWTASADSIIRTWDDHYESINSREHRGNKLGVFSHHYMQTGGILEGGDTRLPFAKCPSSTLPASIPDSFSVRGTEYDLAKLLTQPNIL